VSEILQKEAAAFVDGSAKPQQPKPGRLKRARVGRGMKVGVAITLLAVTGGAVLLNKGHVTTDNAVVTAYVVSLRSPIEGQVSGLQLRVGDTVDGTATLARVVDERANDMHLVDLQAELARGQAEQSALQAQRRTLLALREKLWARAEQYRAAQTADTTAATHEGAAQLVGSAARLDLTRRNMDRKVTLGRLGDAAVATVDQAVVDEQAALADLAYQQAHLVSLQAREAAASQGLFLDNGSNDVSYSAQRIDDIDLRVAEIERAAAALEAGRAAAEARLAAEQRRFAALAAADLRLPNRGMVWKLGASNNERVAVGETVAQVIDCGASFIVASIPQRDFSAVELGGVARFRLAGEKVDREGRVISVTGDANLAGDRNLAAAPITGSAASGTVRVEVPPSGNSGAECLVGRTARVLLPISGGGPVERLLRVVTERLGWLVSI